jgi:L-asparaginase/Glu-tRNA(Gln) amidotransferase subunit D
MNAVKLLFAIVLAMTLSGAALAARPKVVILATGGTIAGAQAQDQDAGYKSGSFQVQDLIKASEART